MSWARIRLGGGVLKIKPRWQMRTVERERWVPVVDLWVVVLCWWSDEALRKFD